MKKDTQVQVIDTTIGDLVFAIREAAEEASVKNEDLNDFTRQMVKRILGNQVILWDEADDQLIN